VPDQSFLDIRHLDAGYGRSQVLFDVNIGIPWRGGVAVLGRNGAGKTTLMKTIVGELASSQGELLFDGRDITRRRTEERVRSGIGYVPQEHSVFARLSVRDNLAVGSLFNADASAVDRVLEIFPKLGASGSTSRPVRCPAASARCWRSAGPCSAIRSCCCWMSRPKASGSA
jgi:branched-chain amino acid transport system ATP-binding protein